MKLEVNITKTKFFMVLGAILVLAAVVGVVAFGTNNPEVFGHSAGEVLIDLDGDGTAETNLQDAIANGEISGEGTGFGNFLVYDSPGTYEFEVLNPNTKKISVQMWGAGGGGSGYGGRGTRINGAGAGAGAYLEKVIDVSQGDTFNIVVGSGGTGGVAAVYNPPASKGVKGTDSTFEGNSVNLVAGAGEGGYIGSVASGGVASGGDFNYNGDEGTIGGGSGSWPGGDSFYYKGGVPNGFTPTFAGGGAGATGGSGQNGGNGRVVVHW